MTRAAANKAKLIIDMGPELKLDGEELLEGKMLLCAKSGAGKTHAVRCFVESACQLVPTIIIDPVGEYSTLREKYDFVLVGEQGEVAASVKTAARLARHLIEKRLNAIVDLSTLTRGEQVEFVATFFKTINALPRSAWGPTFFIIDEIHRFAPEKAYPASRDPLVMLFDSGRLKGFCGIAVSQRQTKVCLDLRAECDNILQGRAVAPAELKVACEMVGLLGKESWPTFRAMKNGQFYAVGPAFMHDGIELRRTHEKTKTTHISSRNRHKIKPPEPRKKILSVAAELDKLIQQTETFSAETATAAQMKARIAELEIQIKKTQFTPMKSEPAKKTTAVVDTAAVEKARTEGYAQAIEGLQPLSGLVNDLQATLSKIGELASQGPNAIKSIVKTLTAVGKASPRTLKANGRAAAPVAVAVPVARASAQLRPGSVQAPARRGSGPGDVRVNKGLRRILTVLAQHPEGVERTQLALLAQFAPTAGHFGNLLSEARRHGWLAEESGRFYPTGDGNEALGEYIPLPEGSALVDYWVAWAKGAGRRVLQEAICAGEAGISREALAIAAGLAPSAGHYGNILSDFRTAKLIDGSKHITASRFLLDAARQ